MTPRARRLVTAATVFMVATLAVGCSDAKPDTVVIEDGTLPAEQSSTTTAPDDTTRTSCLCIQYAAKN